MIFFLRVVILSFYDSLCISYCLLIHDICILDDAFSYSFLFCFNLLLSQKKALVFDLVFKLVATYGDIEGIFPNEFES